MGDFLAVTGFLTAVFVGLGMAAGTAATAAAIVNAVIVVGLSVLSQSLTKKPKLGNSGATNDSTFMVRQSNFPRRICYGRTRLGGIWFYAATTGSKNQYLHLVLGICEGPIEAVDEVYFGDEKIEIDANGDVVTKKYQDHAKVFIHLGDQTTADSELMAADSRWTSDHKLLGIAYSYVQLKHDSKVWDSGLPEISFVTRGSNDVEDTRDGSVGYTNNVALCTRHYYTRSRVGPGLDEDRVDFDFANDAAVICAEQVPLKDGGTEDRYAIDGSFLLDVDPEEIIADMVEAMAGWQVYTGGKFRLYAGYYIPPTFEVNEDMVVATVTTRYKKTRADRVNTIKGLYRNPDNNWQSSDFPTVKNQDAIDVDGIEHLSDKELPFTISHARAQRLAKIDLARARKEIRTTLVCSLRAFPVQAGENVKLTIDYLGFNQHHFYCERAGLTVHDDAPAIELDLVETGADVYDWQPSEDEASMPDPEDVSIDRPAITLTVSPLPGDAEAPMAWMEDGKGQELSVADNSSFDFISEGAFTIIVWFIEDGSTDSLATLIAQGAADLNGVTDAYAITTTDAAGTSRLQAHVKDTELVTQDDGELVTQDDGEQVTLDGDIVSVGPATSVPTGELIMVAVTFDGANTLSVWAKSKDSAYSIDAVATLANGIPASSVKHSVGTANDSTSSFIGKLGSIAMYSSELETDDLDDLFTQGVIGQAPTFDDLSGSQEIDLEHYWNLDELVGTRIDSAGSANLLDTGTVGAGAHKGRVNYPLSLEMESSDSEARILWAETQTQDFVPSSAGTSSYNLYPPASISSIHKKIIARALARTIESDNFVAYYGFDYVTAGWSGNILLWLDSRYGVELDGSGKVENWRDQSAAGNDAFQTTAGNRPAFVANVVNGFPAIRFDGVDEFMLFPQPLNGSQSRSVYMVFKSSVAPSASQNENVLLDMQDGASPGSGEMWALGIERNVRTIGAPDKYQSHRSDLTGARFYVVSVHFNGSTIADDTDLRVFGDNRGVIETASVAVNTASTTNSVLGKSNALASSEFTGDLLQIMIIDHQNGGREKELIHQFLTGLYGL